ncbi:MAG TPA: amidohydrolase family protein [Myxococcota bacterium]|nr:amidohydrolase family protein [Myxococcota bacterium]
MLLLLACAHPQLAETPPESLGIPSSSRYVLRGGRLPGGATIDLAIDQGKIVAVGAVEEGGEEVDLQGRWVVPAFIDSHVHLAYRPADLGAGGVAAAVDLAAPLDFFAEDLAPLRLLRSGPMVTAQGGYPTQSWGRNGYGREVADAAAARGAVGELVAAGADLIKLPITGEPQLGEEALRAAVEEAHLRGRKVVSHALGDVEAALAATVGVDALAHTPVETLDSRTVESWSKAAVITTLNAFGGRSSTLDNLRRLHQAGATLLYGTDFGNTTTAGIDLQEILYLQDAGLSGADILAAGTSTPAAYWGLSELGSLEVGKAASLLVLSADPTQKPEVLATPLVVIIDGKPR